MYARDVSSVYVNLFIGSTVTVEDVGGTDVELVQETEYPWEEHVSITVNPVAPTTFSVRVRVPDRMVSKLYEATPDADGITSISVNGHDVRPEIENGYAVLTRAWEAGDRIDLTLPLKVQRVHADDRIEATRGRVALKYGPLVYNIEEEDQDIHQALAPGSTLTPAWREDFLGGVTVIEGSFANGAPLLAIPNHARDNRVDGTYAPRRPERPADGSRPTPFPPTSIVWIKEG
jgi:DUF1680 family protein